MIIIMNTTMNLLIERGINPNNKYVGIREGRGYVEVGLRKIID